MAESLNQARPSSRISVDNISNLIGGGGGSLNNGHARGTCSPSHLNSSQSDYASGGLLCHKLYEDMLQKYKTIAEQSQQEVASSQFRIKSLESELGELKAKNASAEEQRFNSRTNQNILEEKLQKEVALSSSLQNFYTDIEDKYKQMETAYHDQRINLNELQNLLDEKIAKLKASEEQGILAKETIILLENRLSDYEKSIKKTYINATGNDSEELPIEELLMKIRNCIEDNAGFKEKYENIQGMMGSMENENNAGRATILRLVGEMEAEKANNDILKKETDTLSKEQRILQQQKEQLERDNLELRKCLNIANQKLVEKDQALEKQMSLMQIEITSARHETLQTKNAQTDLQSVHQRELSHLRIDKEKFRNEFVTTFKKFGVNLEPWDNAQALAATLDTLLKLQETTRQKEEFQNQLNVLQQNSAHELQKYELMYKCASMAEEKLKTNTEHIASLESRITFTQADVEELARLKEQFTNFIAKLSTILKLESIMSEVGLNLNVEAVTLRVQKLAEREDATLIEKASIIRRLEKKNRTLRDQLESKELHLDMMRKKLEHADEDSPGGLHYLNTQLRSSMKHNEVLESQLTEAKTKIMELKTILQHVRDIKLHIVDGGDIGNAVDVEWGIETLENAQQQSGDGPNTCTVSQIVENSNCTSKRKTKTDKSKSQEPYLKVKSVKINERS